MMIRFVSHALTALAVTVVAAAALVAGAASAPQFDKRPPGTIVQDVPAYLSGEGMSSRWHVVASREQVGMQMGKTPAYQWYLSVYAPARGDALNLVYRSPGSGSELLTKVTKAQGAQMYFPAQDLKIVGAGELERSGVQDVVVWSHESGADCGMASVTVLGAQSTRVQLRAHIVNYCELDASVVRNGSLQAVQLKGPYYAPSSPVCCPAKPNVTAILSLEGGRVSIKPRYFSAPATRPR